MKQASRITALFTSVLMSVQSVLAAPVYQGGGPLAGVNATTGLAGIPHDGNPRGIIINILQSVLSFMSLVSVATIVIAGIYMIVGLGSDDSKEKAKKIIMYTLIGLSIILFSQIIVGLVTRYLVDQV